MDLPSEAALEETVLEDAPAEYVNSLESSTMYKGFGCLAAAFYIDGGGDVRHLRDAYRLGGTLGLNIRIVDDLLDGDGCVAVKDREGFMDRYIDSVESGEPAHPVERRAEKAAYDAGIELNSVLGGQPQLLNLCDQFRDVRDMVVEEDKATEEGYLNYVNAGGGMIGAATALALDSLPGYSADTQNTDLLFDVGFAGQVCDDMMEDDIGMEEDELREFYERSMERLEEHQTPASQALTSVANLYPVYYRITKLANRVI